MIGVPDEKILEIVASHGLHPPGKKRQRLNPEPLGVTNTFIFCAKRLEEINMGLSLCGWAGDHVVGLQGRRSQRLLLTLTQRDGAGVPWGLVRTISNGILYYPDLNVRCLTPGARYAMGLAVQQLDAFVWSIEIAEVDWGDGRSPWEPGVHLFCIMLQPDGSSEESRTFATAVVDASLRRVENYFDPVAQMDVLRFSN